MLEGDLHDLSDDPDYAASQQQDLGRSFYRSDSVKSTEMGGGESETVYVKDNVAIHPTQYASERISGRLLIVKRGSSLFMTWFPYKLGVGGIDSAGRSSNAEIFERDADRKLYTIKDVPFADVHSIRRHTPPLGWQYIIVVLTSGIAFPPLYFYNGGVREFLATLKQHVFLARSADDANVFLANDIQDPWQRSLSSLEMPRAVSASLHASGGLHLSDENSERRNGSSHVTGSSSEYSGHNKHKIHDPARDISIQVLEKFSLVTKFARETTSHLFRENQSNGPSFHEGKQLDNKPSSEFTDSQKTSSTLVAPDPLEFDKLPLVWGKQRQQPMNTVEWTSFLDAEGRIIDSKALRKRIFYGGVESSIRPEVWKFLLGYYPYDSTYAEREYLASVKKSEYNIIKSQWQSISPAQAKRFTKFKERKGLIEKDVVRTDRSISFYDGDDNPNVAVLHDILLTYSFYNFDLGYCQGMSDLLSPILFIMGDESETFWCFMELMERLGPNFNRDQSGMHSQLFALMKLVELLDSPLHNYFNKNDCLNYFFCFRWLLIQFKREFEYEEVMRLWEVLWTHYLSEHFHLYVCVAILKRYRHKIMGEEMDFDTLLKFINELSGRIHLDDTLRNAEALCACAGENGDACIPPGTPPSLPMEASSMYPMQDQDEI